MSFILDALRKVEKEKKFAPPKFDIKDKVLEPDVSGRSPARYALIAGVTVILLSSAATWAAIIYLKNPAGNDARQHGRPASPVSAGQAMAAVPPAQPAREVSASAPGANAAAAPATEFKTASADVKSAALTVNGGQKPAAPDSSEDRPSPKARRMEKGVVKAEEERIEVGSFDTGADHRVALLEEAAQSPAPVEKNVVPTPPAGKENAAIEPVADTASDGFLLEGVVYHNDPQKRSAMLRQAGNAIGKMVRIGDKIEGLQVAQINQKSITLRKGDTPTTITMD